MTEKMTEIEAVKKYLAEVAVWDSMRRAYVGNLTQLVNSGDFDAEIATKLVKGVKEMFYNAWDSERKVLEALKSPEGVQKNETL